MYRTLDATRIIETLQQLQRRVSERFPGGGLARVRAELTEIAKETQARATSIRRPDWMLRTIVGAVLVTGLVLLIALGSIMLSSTRASDDLFGTLQGVDSAFNILVLMGASLFFLVSLEDRRKRKLSLQALHELRSIVHVIDM